MPLARFALYESGVEIYIASTADDGDAWQATLVHIARESRAFVVSPSHFQRAASYPDDFPLRRLIEGTGIDRPRRLGDPRARRRLPRRPALRRGGDPLRRARPGRALGRAAAVRRGGPLPPARRARPPPDAAPVVSSAVVVGAGVFGASTARELDRRGWDVTLVEQYSPGQHRAPGSGGDTRLLRFSHGDEEWYTLAARALARALARARGRASGCRSSSRSASRGSTRARATSPTRARQTLERLGIACERLDPAGGEAPVPVARRRRSPLRALRARRRRPQRAGGDPGARRRPRPRGRTGRPPPSRRGRTSSSGRAAPGCRSSSRTSSSSGSRAATSSSSASTRAGTARRASASTTARTTATASSTGSGMKISPDGRRRRDRPRRARAPPRPRDGGARPRVRGAPLPGARRTPRSSARASASTTSPTDTHFLVARHPEHGNWWLVGGGSGHGFKHGPALGEYVADCVEGSREPEPFHALGPRAGHAGLRTADVEA